MKKLSQSGFAGILGLFSLLIVIMGILAGVYLVKNYSTNPKTQATGETIKFVDDQGNTINSTTSNIVKVSLTAPVWSATSSSFLKLIPNLSLIKDAQAATLYTVSGKLYDQKTNQGIGAGLTIETCADPSFRSNPKVSSDGTFSFQVRDKETYCVRAPQVSGYSLSGTCCYEWQIANINCQTSSDPVCGGSSDESSGAKEQDRSTDSGFNFAYQASGNSGGGGSGDSGKVKVSGKAYDKATNKPVGVGLTVATCGGAKRDPVIQSDGSFQFKVDQGGLFCVRAPDVSRYTNNCCYEWQIAGVDCAAHPKSADCQQGDAKTMDQSTDSNYNIIYTSKTKPTPTPNPQTKSVVLAEDPNFTINSKTLDFTTSPISYTFSDSTPGLKVLYAKFIAIDGRVQNASPFPAQIQLINASSKPNIIVVMTDDQTLQSMAYLPKVNSLIRDQGSEFTNFFVSSSLCCPSRSEFLTGQYAHNNGVISNQPPNGGYDKLDNTNTLAVWLKNSGYYTGLVGKYLNGFGNAKNADPKALPPGWSDFHGGWGQSFYSSYFNYTLDENGKLVDYKDDGVTDNSYMTNVLTQRAVDFINGRKNDSNPFFLWLTYFTPHEDASVDGPTPARKYQGKFASEPLPKPASFNEADVSDKPQMVQDFALLNSSDISHITNHYRHTLEALQSVDDGVETLINTLQTAGKLENTIIMFTSDNGYFNGEHRKPKGKSMLYENSIHLPLLVSGPGIPHQSIDRAVVNIDFAPTIVDFSGATAKRTMDGMSFRGLIASPAISWRDSFLLDGPENEYTAVRTKQYIYAEHTSGGKNPNELYDLFSDPDELTNLMYTNSKSLNQGLVTMLHQLKTCNGSNCNVPLASGLLPWTSSTSSAGLK
ncbi:sulfatase [Candidatus Daviesbacteria bacterium]|nr:sulfatase [Candidatus Daviesbacteria bacterium]